MNLSCFLLNKIKNQNAKVDAVGEADEVGVSAAEEESGTDVGSAGETEGCGSSMESEDDKLDPTEDNLLLEGWKEAKQMTKNFQMDGIITRKE